MYNVGCATELNRAGNIASFNEEDFSYINQGMTINMTRSVIREIPKLVHQNMERTVDFFEEIAAESERAGCSKRSN